MGKMFHFCSRPGMRVASREKKTCVAKRRTGIRSVAAEDVEYGSAMIVIVYAWRAVKMNICSDVEDIQSYECDEGLSDFGVYQG
jgi:hypothetical protein